MARRSILLTVAFAIAALGTAMIIMYVQGIDARAADKFEKTEVVRADMVDGALSSTASIDNQVALGTIYPGQQIMGQQFGKPGSEDTLTIPDNLLAVSVELTDPERVAGFVNPGSQVAIFASADPEIYKPDGTTQKLAPYTRILLPEVPVIGVGDTTMTPRTTTSGYGKATTTEKIPRTILTLAVTQDQAERVIYASRNGDL